MRVICIENSILVDEDNPNFGGICTHKGSIYHVIRSVEGQQMREESGIPYALGPWYEFLEVKGLHHHIRFLEIPEDDIEINEKSIQHNII